MSSEIQKTVQINQVSGQTSPSSNVSSSNDTLDMSIWDNLDKNNDGKISIEEAKEYGFSSFEITKTLTKEEFEKKVNEYNKSNKTQLWQKQPFAAFTEKSNFNLIFDEETQQCMAKVPYMLEKGYMTMEQLQKEQIISLNLSDVPLKDIDFTKNPDLLKLIQFNDKTFTSSCKLPENYNPQKITELGINPGLNVRAMQQAGITGKGVKIAIFDWRLSPHKEYNSKIKCYEEMKNGNEDTSTYHSTPVTAIAAGENCGIAKDADVFFFALTCSVDGDDLANAQISALKRILEINSKLPKNERIRVISMSASFADNKEAQKLVKQLNDSGCWVISSESCFDDFGYLEKKDPMGNPDDFSNYKPTPYNHAKNPLYVNSGNRTVPDCTNSETYRHDSPACASWAIPYVAGLYACACQVDPEITPEKFIEAAHKTANKQQAFKKDKNAENANAKNEVMFAGQIELHKQSAAKLFPNVSWDEINSDSEKLLQIIAYEEKTYGTAINSYIEKLAAQYKQKLIQEGKIDNDYNWIPPYDQEEISIIDAKALMDYLKENKTK